MATPLRPPPSELAATSHIAQFTTTSRSASGAPATESMSKRSQLVVVATATLAFAGLLVYLSAVLYPLVVLAGAYVVLEQITATNQRGSRLWRSIQRRLEQCRAVLTGTRDPSPFVPHDTRSSTPSRSPSPTAASSDANKALGSPGKRRSRVIAIKTATHATPSLRVTNVGVTRDGRPQALPDHSQDVLDYIVEPNSIEPYEFENEFMTGRLLFLLQRSEEPTPPKYLTLFQGKRRLFWVQLQVKFKKVPSGILYIGGEVPRRMNLGFFTGGLTKIILSVLQSLVRGLHCSFGQLYPAAVSHEDDEELPHICFPLYTAVDQFVVTSPGDKPPALGSADFGESKEAMAARRKSGQPLYQYNTTDTYSFHFHSFFIDFVNWRVNGLPGMKDTELRTFWDDMPLRLCAYSLKPQPGSDPTSEADAKKLVHSWHAKEYNFCFQLSHKIQDEYEIVNEDEDEDEAVEDGPRASELATQQAEMQAALARYEFSIPVWVEYFSAAPPRAERRVGYALRVRERGMGSDAAGATDYYYVLLTAVAAFSPLSFIEHELTSSTTGRRNSRHRSGSGIFASSKAKTLEEAISVRSHQSRYAKIDDERQFLEHHLKELAIPQGANTQFRPDLVLSAQAALLDILQRKTMSLGSEWPFLISAFGRKNSFGSATSDNDGEGPSGDASDPPVQELRVHAAHQIVRAISSSCWRNEWVTIDKAQRMLRFFRMLTSSPSCSVSLDAILVLEDDLSFGGADVGSDEKAAELFWLRVVTIERCHHVAFASIVDRRQWSAALTSDIEARGQSMEAVLQQPVVTSCLRITLDSFEKADTGSKSRGAKRSIINDRCHFSTTTTKEDASMITLDTSDPNAVVAAALREALRLQQDRLADYSTRDFLGFLDTVGLLKWLSLESILHSETEKKVFLLNLYHLMLVHASLLGFLPKSKTQWSKFFNGVNYNIGGFYVSIAEVEHGLIRVPMAPLKHAMAFLVIPKIGDHDERAPLRLTTGDFRLTFALNCLTKSCLNAIMVFTTADLERQLDRMTALTVDYAVSYDRESKILYLPKVCEWYRADFTSDASHRWHHACLAVLRTYMDGPKAQLIDYLLQHEQTLVAKWKIAKYDYHFHEVLHEAALPPQTTGENEEAT